MARNVGGSLLPSNDARILQPVETPFGTLQVRVIVELDTHGLFHKHAAGESLLATHPNGYSCHSLLERMVARNEERIRNQVAYILACGGTVRHVDHIVASVDAVTDGKSGWDVLREQSQRMADAIETELQAGVPDYQRPLLRK